MEIESKSTLRKWWLQRVVTREGFGCAEQKSADRGRQPTAAGWATPTKGSTQIPQSGSKTSTKTSPLHALSPLLTCRHGLLQTSLLMVHPVWAGAQSVL